jgi:cytochrome c553
MKFNATVGLAALLIVSGRSSQAQQFDVAKFAGQVCESCHGPGGRSASPAFPRLAGQQKDYMETQLKALRGRTRANPTDQAYMWVMASQLTDDEITQLAAYFSQQVPSPGKAVQNPDRLVKEGEDPRLVREGEALFENGVPAKLEACAKCHGKGGLGDGVYPRLASQHAEYLILQMATFKSQLRAGANAPVMHTETADMTFEQMRAIAAYLTSR